MARIPPPPPPLSTIGPMGPSAANMRLRDWFAGQLAPELLREAQTGDWLVRPGEKPSAKIAEFAYELADALLAARSNEVQP